MEYNPADGITTLRTDLEGARADTTSMEYSTAVSYAGGFSPDNSQLVANGWGETDRFGSVMFSVYAADATAPGPVTEVDGTDRQARLAIWGP